MSDNKLSDLITDVSAGQSSLVSLLRRAKVLATQARNEDLLAWVNNELDGYKAEAPEYRTLRGVTKALNPVRGWQPIQFQSDDVEKKLSRRRTNQSVGELEELVRSDSETLAMPYPPELLADFQEAIDFVTDIQLHFSKAHIKGVLEAIRNRLLDKLLLIEMQGAQLSGNHSSKKDSIVFEDEINKALKDIGDHLPAMRSGMWEALNSDHADAGRQAAHSARELVDQVLKTGAPDATTRKERAKVLMTKHRGKVSETDLEVIVANCELIEAEHNKLLKLAHGRSTVDNREARDSVQAAERALGLLLEE